jgi:hypothetical protein
VEDATANDLQDQLESLRPELLVDRGRPFLDLFDEFMRQREFGLALHAVCDFILDQDSPRVNKSSIDLVQRLHTAMKINDGCVLEMQQNQ